MKIDLKNGQNLAKIISGNLEITMEEIKSLKNEVNELKKSMEFPQNDLEERLNNVEENMRKLKEDLKEIYEYQIDPDYVNDSLADIRNKLNEHEDRPGRNKIQIDGIAQEPGKHGKNVRGRFIVYLVKNLI